MATRIDRFQARAASPNLPAVRLAAAPPALPPNADTAASPLAVPGGGGADAPRGIMPVIGQCASIWCRTIKPAYQPDSGVGHPWAMNVAAYRTPASARHSVSTSAT